MKKFIKIIPGVLLVIFFISPAFAQKPSVKPAVASIPKLTTPNDSLQYTLGAYLGQWVTNNGFAVTNADLFIKGMNDVLTNKTLMIPAATVAAKLDSYQKRLISAKSSQQERLLFENIRGKAGVGAMPNGVSYIIMKAGNGVRPRLTDSISIHVKGLLPDGKLFEDTYAKKTPLRGTPATYIPGLKEALQIMPAGSTWRIFVPSALGYAEKGVPGVVPAYSALIFEVELLNVTSIQ
jgi:FKBP-type peptidyl-prolyl cis-trans isomerase